MIVIYEVMAIEKSLPLFFNQHIDRFTASINRYLPLKREDVYRETLTLVKEKLNYIKEQGINNVNLKIEIDIESSIFKSSIIKSRRPDSESYIKGVTCGFLESERENPLIKKVNKTQRELSEAICLENGFYDVLLVNSKGNITEGSRSNFLAIKDCKVYTSPIGTALNGITRLMIFEACKSMNIEVIEYKITKDFLKQCDSLVITGTSPEILPVRVCQDISFSVDNHLIKKLQNGYLTQKELDYKKVIDLF